MTARLSETEWGIMEVLWERAPLSASEVHEHLPGSRAATPKTVRTLLDRLRAKNAVNRERVHGVWVFTPLVQRDECLHEESRTFLKRFFGDNPVPLVEHLLRHEELSERELAELRALDRKSVV